jgi:WD40 repeat protein
MPTLVATASNKKVAVMWDVESGTLLKKLPPEANLYCVIFSPESSMLATGGHDETLMLWSTKTFEKFARCRRTRERFIGLRLRRARKTIS